MRFRKQVLTAIIMVCFVSVSHSQVSHAEACLLRKLDSIGRSSSVSSYFAGLYFETTAHAIDFFANCDPAIQRSIERMELRFAQYFLDAADACEKKAPVPIAWKTYCEDSSASALRHTLLGINAHLNGDIWRALTTEFSLEELRAIKPYYFSYYSELTKLYNDIYFAALESSARLRFIHIVSFGFDEPYGKALLRRWLNRQVELAELYFTNKPAFERKLKKLERKLHRIDRLVLKNT